jgi:hypothetical protein
MTEKEFNKLDKRTRVYKEWKANFDNKSKGLGDTVEKITEVTGIKNVVKSVLGDDCGCDDRKEKLNKFMRYKIVNCLSENDYNFLKNVIEKGGKIKPETQIKMKAIFENTFNKKLTSNCLSCSFVSEIYRPLRNLIEKYD